VAFFSKNVSLFDASPRSSEKIGFNFQFDGQRERLKREGSTSAFSVFFAKNQSQAIKYSQLLEEIKLFIFILPVWLVD
jgi:hypothetical protein